MTSSSGIAPPAARGWIATAAAELAARAASSVAGEPAWLTHFRGEGMARAMERGVPGAKDEAWRFISLSRIASAPLGLAPAAGPAAGVTGIEARLPGDRWRAVFVNGRFAASRSRLPGGLDGVRVETLAEACACTSEGEIPLAHDATRGASTVTSDLNDALFQDGLIVRIAAGRRLEGQLYVLHIAAPGSAPSACHPRLVVELGEGASAHLVEEYVTVPGGTILTNAVAEVMLAAGSSLTRDILRTEPAGAIHLGLARIHMGRDSVLRQTEIAQVSGTLRSEIRIALDGEGADPDLGGLTVARGEGQADLQTLVVHSRPRGTSRQIYKAILLEAARTRFLGKIQVEPEARKTSAWQMNRNLVASDAALAQSTPQLEILADEVQCRHGSTTGQLDEEMLFYLRSRGLGAEEARDVLTRAFAREVLDRLRLPEVKEWLGETILPAPSGTGEAA